MKILGKIHMEVQMARRARKARLYGADGVPSSDFNKMVKSWLEGDLPVKEHTSPAAFDGVRKKYMEAVDVAVSAGLDRAVAHREALNKLTELLFGYDIAEELAERLNPGLVNDSGFRTTLSQGVAKNVGENFVNLMVYALADTLAEQDEILVDKGLPPALKSALELKRTVPLKTGSMDISIPIEGDMAIFSRSGSVAQIL